MKQTVEALYDSAVALDQHLLSDRSVSVIKYALAAECALGLVVAAGMHDTASPAESIRVTSEAEVSEIVVGTSPTMASQVLPLAKVPNPKPHLKRSTSPKPTDFKLNPSWHQVHLEDNPTAKARSILADVLNTRPTTHSIVDLARYQCESPDYVQQGIEVDQPVDPKVEDRLKRIPLGIVQVTHGRPFTANQCLQKQAELSQAYDFYLFPDNPGLNVMRSKIKTGPYICEDNEAQCIAESYGYQVANHALYVVKAAKLHAPKDYWWIDVERADTWKGTGTENRWVLTGVMKALRASNPHSKIGFYSVPASDKNTGLWTHITGYKDQDGIYRHPWLNHEDSWIATGTGSRDAAWRACKARKSFTAGRNILSQYSITIEDFPAPKPDHVVDGNVACPAN